MNKTVTHVDLTLGYPRWLQTKNGWIIVDKSHPKWGVALTYNQFRDKTDTKKDKRKIGKVYKEKGLYKVQGLKGTFDYTCKKQAQVAGEYLEWLADTGGTNGGFVGEARARWLAKRIN